MTHFLKEKFMKYSVSQLLYLGICLVLTKFLVPNARLIRMPVDIRGKRYIDFGTGLTTGYLCRLEAYPTDNNRVLFFGENVQINDFVHIAAKESVKIGNNVLIASKVFISDLNHGSYAGGENDIKPYSIPRLRPETSKPVTIGDNVWLGESVMILPGVTIGEGAVVGAASVVTKDIPPFSIAVGNPARVIKQFCKERQRWNKV